MIPLKDSAASAGSITAFHAETYCKEKPQAIGSHGPAVVLPPKLPWKRGGRLQLTEHPADCAGTMSGVYNIGKFIDALEKDRLRIHGFANTESCGAGQTAISNLRRHQLTIATDRHPASALVTLRPDPFGGQTAMLAGGADEFCLESFCGFGPGRNADTSQIPSRFPSPFIHRTGFAVVRLPLADVEEWETR